MATTPRLIICFGVSGCGKSTLAQHLAEQYSLHYIEADDFHPPENKAHMAAGKALTDEMREPWMNALCEYLRQQQAAGRNCVMAHSGLRRAHRQRFRGLGFSTLFLHLHGPRDLIYERMQARSDHYMPPSLLDSQFAALEPVANEPDVVVIDIAQDIPAIAAEAEQKAQAFLAG